MLLSRQDAELFFKLHRSLMRFVNQKLAAIPQRPATDIEYGSLPAESRSKVHLALLDHLDLLNSYAHENPAGFSQDELDIVLSWRNLIHGKFYVLRELQNYTVFLSAAKSSVAYGVLALSQPFEELVGPYLPVLVEAILLPFKGRIIYDGVMSTFNISFGSGVRRSLNEGFKEAKARHGIVTSLPMSDAPVSAKVPKPAPVREPPSKEDTAAVLREVVGMTDQFCRAKLNDEYAVVCRALAEKLSRKRPSPLLSGKPNTWAGGIVRTIGWVNFLHDKSQTPHMRTGDIDAAFGISQATGAAKQAAIRKMFKMHPFDPAWTLPSRLADNPLLGMFGLNGFMMNVRRAGR